MVSYVPIMPSPPKMVIGPMLGGICLWTGKQIRCERYLSGDPEGIAQLFDG